MAKLDMEETLEFIDYALKRYGFRAAAEEVFNKEPPPAEIVQIIFDIKKRAAIGILRVEQSGNRWIRLNWTIRGEIGGEFAGTKTFPSPSGVSLLNGRQNDAFMARYRAIFPGYEWKKQLRSAIYALADFRNPRLLYLRQDRFAAPIVVEVVPPDCVEAKRLANMGDLAKAYSMAWLAAQLPLKFSDAQMAELEGISKKRGWHFEQGKPIFPK